MKYRKIKNSNLEVSVIGLGTWVFGGDLWGGSQEADCIDAVHTAIDHGINLIDTAPIYGNGRSEEIVGKAIKGKRDKVVIATKCGLLSNGKRIVNNLSPQSIYKEIDDSLKRLQIDCIDLYQCHWPDSNTPIEKTMEALTQLKEKGKIRYIGVSNFELALLKESISSADVVSLQSHYSLLNRSLEKEIIPFCLQKGMGVLCYGVLGGGILSGKYASVPTFKGADARHFLYPYYQGKNFERVQDILSSLEKFQRPFNQIAINWVRQREGITSVLVGCRNAQQTLENIKACEWDLSEQQIKKMDEMILK